MATYFYGRSGRPGLPEQREKFCPLQKTDVRVPRSILYTNGFWKLREKLERGREKKDEEK